MQIADIFKRSVASVSLALCAALSSQAMAAPAFVIDNLTGLGLGNPPFTLGWQFSTSTSISVNSLGLFDDSQNGLAERHAIGLWDSAGTLLASTILGAGVADPLTNQFRYSSIASVILGPGTYQVGALYPTGADALIFPGDANGFATASEVTFLDSAFAAGSGLTNPTTSGGTSPSYFGPNFLFNQVNRVPEPTSLLLAGLALAALGATRRTARPKH